MVVLLHSCMMLLFFFFFAANTILESRRCALRFESLTHLLSLWPHSSNFVLSHIILFFQKLLDFGAGASFLVSTLSIYDNVKLAVDIKPDEHSCPWWDTTSDHNFNSGKWTNEDKSLSSFLFCFLKQNLYECGLGPDGGGCEICPGHSERGQCDRNPHEVH